MHGRRYSPASLRHLLGLRLAADRWAPTWPTRAGRWRTWPTAYLTCSRSCGVDSLLFVPVASAPTALAGLPPSSAAASHLASLCASPTAFLLKERLQLPAASSQLVSGLLGTRLCMVCMFQRGGVRNSFGYR